LDHRRSAVIHFPAGGKARVGGLRKWENGGDLPVDSCQTMLLAVRIACECILMARHNGRLLVFPPSLRWPTDADKPGKAGKKEKLGGRKGGENAAPSVATLKTVVVDVYLS